mmetsp:Transcript_59726/g.112627  ORF Transcript_59726/g.112627 Transcript_59726/m.112627 type:complete len:335 (+) Transcript_59726:77-1081(+)
MGEFDSRLTTKEADSSLLPLLLAAFSTAAADHKTLSTLTTCNRTLAEFLTDADHVVWRCAFEFATQHDIVPRVAHQSKLCWRELLCARSPLHAASRVHVVEQHALQAGDVIDWTASVAVIGPPSSLKKDFLNRLVHVDVAGNTLHPLLFRASRTRSCIVRAFGSLGRLVFTDVDWDDFLVQHLKCDAAIVVCDAREVAASHAAREGGLMRAISQYSLCRTGDPIICLLALASRDRSSVVDRSDQPRISCQLEKLLLADVVEQLDCEALTVSMEDPAGVDTTLQLLTWNLVAQSAERRRRLRDSGRHELLAPAHFAKSRALSSPAGQRRASSQGP